MLQEVVPQSEVMSENDARVCINHIISGIDQIRLSLLRLDEGRGWIALGYNSLGECLDHEVTIVTNYSSSYLRRQLNAALLESNNGMQCGTLKESHARKIHETLSDGNLRDKALAIAINTAEENNVKLTASICEDAAMKVYVSESSFESIKERMLGGYISAPDAYEIVKQIEPIEDNEFFCSLAQRASDPKLVEPLFNLMLNNSEIWKEIAMSATIGGDIAIEDASVRDLQRHFDELNRQEFLKNEGNQINYFIREIQKCASNIHDLNKKTKRSEKVEYWSQRILEMVREIESEVI